jgi:hypothetical protein
MAGEIMWLNSLKHALETAQKEDKLVLVDFFTPG